MTPIPEHGPPDGATAQADTAMSASGKCASGNGGPAIELALGTTPAEDRTAAAGRVCGRCSAPNATDADRCAQCQSFLTGNAAAVKTGIYRREAPPDLRESADVIIAGIIEDRGGIDELTTAERATIRNLGDVAILLRLLMNDMARNGLLTPAGSVRGAYGQYLAGIDRFDRLASRIGLTRRAKRVASPLDYIEGRADV